MFIKLPMFDCSGATCVGSIAPEAKSTLVPIWVRKDSDPETLKKLEESSPLLFLLLSSLY